VRISDKGERYYETSKTYWGLRNLTRKFDVVDYTDKILTNPNMFGYQDIFSKHRILAFLISLFSPILKYFAPTFFWILKKDDLPRGFVAAYICHDVYGTTFGEIWMASVEAGAKLKNFIWNTLHTWFKFRGVSVVVALDAVGTKAKRRWLASFGAKPEFNIHMRKI